MDTLNLKPGIIKFGAPPDMFHQTFLKDFICETYSSKTYKKVSSEGHFYSNQKQKILRNTYVFNYDLCNGSFDGGLLTGIYKPGEYGYFSMKCTIIARRNTMLTFCTSLVLNKGVKDEYLRSFSDGKDLRELN